MTPEAFIEKWGKAALTETAASQEHFVDLCALLDIDPPAKADPKGRKFAFAKTVKKPDGRTGFADVWKKGCFAWEYKRDRKNLVAAYAQLKDYADTLENPPLLIVSDMREIRIHTNFNSEVAERIDIKLGDLKSPEILQRLRWAFDEPERLRPTKTRAAVTADAARAFARLAQRLRDRKHPPQAVAHFLNRLVFCMFVEDVGLLPDRIFADIVEEGLAHHDAFDDLLGDLFRKMRDGKGYFGTTPIPWFNGGLFDDDTVLATTFVDINDISEAARLDWAAIEPSIFGSLFEKGLDPERRKEMASLFDAAAANGVVAITAGKEQAADRGVGIHYTDPATIMKIIVPVILRPLKREWQELKARLADKKIKNREALYRAFRKRLAEVTVLDPASGSGNFLYLALLHLKDLELAVKREGEALGLSAIPLAIGPDNLHGIEINPYAAELARVTIWIGEIQWQIRNGFKVTRRPILSTLDTIECRDAILAKEGEWEAPWPDAEFIVGNPPFLGNKRMISALGEEYVQRLRATFKDRLPGSVDLVCYWFEKARAMIEGARTKRVGLVTTSAIRGGANRMALERVRETGSIFEAWSDQPWVIDGAAVRVSLVEFGRKGEPDKPRLDDAAVGQIFADLSGASSPLGEGLDLTKAHRLLENADVSFMGSTKVGSFDVGGELARKWLVSPHNPNGRANSDVVRPWANGMDITRRPSDTWIVDFGTGMTETEAALYELPFEYVRRHVKPFRADNRRDAYKARWWLHAEPREGLRSAIASLKRIIVTPRVAKHRLFVWLSTAVLPDSRLYAIARQDDSAFGVLHSHMHEVWSLATCSWHGVGNDPTYNTGTCFETFPFPEGLSPNTPAKDYASDPRAQAIAAAAKRLDELRENWLNPPELVRREPEVVPGFPERLIARGPKAEAELKKRTLTNLYNQRPQWLADAHQSLDAAVAAAYGWPADLADDDILARLLALNLARAKQQ